VTSIAFFHNPNPQVIVLCDNIPEFEPRFKCAGTPGLPRMNDFNQAVSPVFPEWFYQSCVKIEKPDPG
jgi:hypothetical protein